MDERVGFTFDVAVLNPEAGITEAEDRTSGPRGSAAIFFTPVDAEVPEVAGR